MQEVNFWLVDGEHDYRNIYGNTGPLVYPAGFMYLFGWLQFVTNGEIPKAQYVFLVFYIVTQMIVFALYYIVLQQLRRSFNNKHDNKLTNDDKTTTTALALGHQVWSFRIAMGCLCLSKRYHSIFLLRLFNDGPTMMFAYLSFWCFINRRWNIGCFLFSIAVSLKMNVLLFAPGLLYLLLQDNLRMTIPRLAICGMTQIVIGAPFLFRYPISYLRKAFELDRQFFFKWTVNFKFLEEEMFLSKQWAIFLLVLHLGLLGVYHYKLYNNKRRQSTSSEQILSTLFVSNFIGICCARTLHYQFYSWYFSSLPYLLWRETPYPMPIKILLLGCIEYAFLTFPATPISSLVLQVAHWTILMPCVLLIGNGDSNKATTTSPVGESTTEKQD
jgi:alpha-1,3-mannosyltransferase